MCIFLQLVESGAFWFTLGRSRNFYLSLSCYFVCGRKTLPLTDLCISKALFKGWKKDQASKIILKGQKLSSQNDSDLVFSAGDEGEENFDLCCDTYSIFRFSVHISNGHKIFVFILEGH